MSNNTYQYAIGRRKSATATVRLTNGKGVITVNGQPAAEYFEASEHSLWDLDTPLRLIGKSDSFDISLKVKGGGKAGQIDAAKLAIAKALAGQDEALRTTLKKAGLLKRDPREKERKKYGLRSARKKEQFSKR